MLKEKLPVNQKLPLKNLWILWFVSAVIFTGTTIGMYEEILLSDLYWIGLTSFSGVIGLVTLWGVIKALVKDTDNNKLGYFISTIISILLLILLLNNYENVLIMLGLRQPYDWSNYQPMPQY